VDIIVKGRRTDVNDRFRKHVTDKLAKIEKLDQKMIRVDVEVSLERNPRQADRRERVELTIRSRGPVIRAEAAADDRYSALDLAVGKLESRLRRIADRRKVHHGSRPPAKLATMESLPESEMAGEVAGMAGTTAAATSEPRPVGTALVDRVDTDYETPPDLDGHMVPIPMEGDGPVVLREKFHKAAPMTIEQALFEMELVGHDFFLFRDEKTHHPSVVYRRRGWDYGVIRLVEE
jgi:ribosomal subunit interface protein